MPQTAQRTVARMLTTDEVSRALLSNLTERGSVGVAVERMRTLLLQHKEAAQVKQWTEHKQYRELVDWLKKGNGWTAVPDILKTIVPNVPLKWGKLIMLTCIPLLRSGKDHYSKPEQEAIMYETLNATIEHMLLNADSHGLFRSMVIEGFASTPYVRRQAESGKALLTTILSDGYAAPRQVDQDFQALRAHNYPIDSADGQAALELALEAGDWQSDEPDEPEEQHPLWQLVKYLFKAGLPMTLERAKQIWTAEGESNSSDEYISGMDPYWNQLTDSELEEGLVFIDRARHNGAELQILQLIQTLINRHKNNPLQRPRLVSLVQTYYDYVMGYLPVDQRKLITQGVLPEFFLKD